MATSGYYTPKHLDTPVSMYKTPLSEPIISDSEASTNGNTDSESGTDNLGSTEGLTLVAEFDELMRILKRRRNNEVEDAFLQFTEQTMELHIQLSKAQFECSRLQVELDKKTHDFSDLESQLIVARKLLDKEKRLTRKVEDERDDLEAQIIRVRDLLFKENKNRIPDDTLEQVAFLNNNNGYNVAQGLSAIQEINSTGSLLTDLSYSRSEDDLDRTAPSLTKTWKKHRPSTTQLPEPATKKRRASGAKAVEISNNEKVRATTTLTVQTGGPITATSIIESIPVDDARRDLPVEPSAPPANLIRDIWSTCSPSRGGVPKFREHCLQQKTVVIPDTCGVCEERVKFARTAFKCKNCGLFCHTECKNNLPLPCIPNMGTPTQKGFTGVVSDFTPTTPPMIPALIMHCVKEIELRGLNEIGLYRVPGSEKDVKLLKEKFLKGKVVPNLRQIDINVICGTLKDFLRSLNEPLIPHGKWAHFVKAVEVRDGQDAAHSICKLIQELPQPNRDTIAYLMLHLKKISEIPDCKMSISNLAKVFAPTIVGYSSSNPEPSCLLTETAQQCIVMETLLNLPIDYWSSFVNPVVHLTTPSRLQQTPSTDSLLRGGSATTNMFTPQSVRKLKRKQKYFPTPPNFH